MLCRPLSGQKFGPAALPVAMQSNFCRGIPFSLCSGARESVSFGEENVLVRWVSKRQERLRAQKRRGKGEQEKEEQGETGAGEGEDDTRFVGVHPCLLLGQHAACHLNFAPQGRRNPHAYRLAPFSCAARLDYSSFVTASAVRHPQSLPLSAELRTRVVNLRRYACPALSAIV